MSPKPVIQSVVNLTPMQEGMLYHALMNPQSHAYFEQFSCTLEGVLDLATLERSVNALAQKYDIFRTNFFYEGTKTPKQVVFKERSYKVAFEDVSAMDAAEQEQYLAQQISGDKDRGFNLAKDRLLRMSVYQTGARRFKLIWSYHHILMDGWCLKTVVQEIFDTYNAVRSGQRLVVDPMPPFSNYVKWLEKQDREEARRYWSRYLDGYELKAELPKREANREDSGYRQVDAVFSIDEETAAKLDRIAKEQNVTLNTVLQTAWGLLIGRYANTEDIVFGTVTSGRPAEVDGIEEMVGLFINTVPVRVTYHGDQTFAELVRSVQAQELESKNYEYYPLADIQSVSALRQNLIDSIYAFQNFPASSEDGDEAGQVDFDIVEAEGFEQTNYDLNIIVMRNRGLDVNLKYNANVFSEAQMERLGRHFANLLVAVSQQADAPIRNIPIAGDEEREQIVQVFNDTAADYPRDKTVHELFAMQAAQTPDRVALVGDGVQYTYKELNARADRLAAVLCQKGVGAGRIVALLGERAPETVIGMLGIMRAGGAYLPIDPEYPAERIDYMLQDSRTELLLAQPGYGEVVQREGIETIVLDETLLAGEAEPIQFGSGTPDDLAYVMYTSGSTGRPKGVMVEHRNVVRLVQNTNYVTFNEGDRILQTGSPVFDACTFEIWGALLNGLELHLVDKLTILDADRLEQELVSRQITTMWLTAPLFHQLSLQKPAMFRTVRQLIVGGDVLSAKRINSVRAHCPGLQIINGYGPTENTTFSTAFAIDRDYAANIPIGQPIRNSTAYIVDRYGNLNPVGVPGELWVGGDGVARGYLYNEEMTEEKFIPDPFGTSGRVYRTGDLACWLADGSIDYIGRVDHQIKIRGFRVEIGEIENRILQHQAVKEAVVVVHDEGEGSKSLLAYIVAEGKIDADALRAYLGEHLPEYMIPSYLMFVNKMPLTANGKVDRGALPKPEASVAAAQTDAPPRNEIEQKLADIWREILGTDAIGVYDNFFDIGGHSLNAIKLVSAIRKEFETDIALRDVFDNPVLAEIARRISGGDTAEQEQIEPVAEAAQYPVSSAQRRLLILNQMEGLGTAYNMPFALQLEGDVDRERLQAVFRALIERHESLRTSFDVRDGEPVQIVQEAVPFEIETLVWKEGETAEQVMADFVRPFELKQAPLMRVGMGETADGRQLMIVDLHHIIADGSSMGVLIEDFGKLYDGQALPDLRIQYKDYAAWQHRQADGEAAVKREQFWLERFRGELPTLELPTDKPRPQVQSFTGASLSVPVEDALKAKIMQLASDNGATLYMVMLAALNVLLSKYTGQEDIIVGSPIAGRSHADLEPIVGMFVNTLAMRNAPHAGKTFEDFLSEVKANALGAFEHQDYQYETLVDKLNLKRDLSRNPLFDVMFAVQNLGLRDVATSGLRMSSCKVETVISKFDMTVFVIEDEQGMRLDFEYATHLFEAATITRIAHHLTNILQVVTDNAAVRLADITMLSAQEREQILHSFNDTQADFPQDTTIHQLFEQQVERTPDHLALVGGEEQLTYRELNVRADTFADQLQARGIAGGQIVAILLEPSVEMIVSVLGVLKAGAAYVPIDHEYPAERVKYILQDSGATLLLTRKELAVETDVPVAEVDTLTHAPTINGTQHERAYAPDDLAYVIYTSGSTGRPKGVEIEHRTLVNMSEWYRTYYGLSESDRCTKYAGFGFDASVWEIFPCLIAGSTLYIAPQAIRLDVEQLNQFFEATGITVSFLPTQVCERFLPLNNRSLRVLITGGDKLKLAAPQSYELYNNYGPTENTVVATAFRVDGDYRNIPIGQPISNVQLYIVDKHNQLLPVGVPGELCLGGDSLARGYLNRPELTAEKFVPNPFAPGRRMYKTGDLARWLPDGNVEYLGRIDDQVKIRGFRIELGEIESELLQDSSIREAVVLAVEHSGDALLCAYLVRDERVSVDAIKKRLGQVLPGYMIPTMFIDLEKLPLTPNGKVDRRALPQPDLGLSDVYTAPRNATEQQLADIWSEVLGVEQVGVHSNFFDLGGHSLKAATLVARLNQAFEVDLLLSDLFKLPTVEELATRITAAEKTAVERIEAVPQADWYPVSSAQKRLLILSRMEGLGTAYNMPIALQLEGEVDRAKLAGVFRRLIQRHESLRTSFAFHDGEPVQIVHAAVPFEIETMAPADFVRPFDVSQAPLMRAGLSELEDGRQILIVDLHHLIADGASMGTLVEDFGRLYEGESLPALRIQYKDYAAWQHRQADGATAAEREQFWLDMFSGELPVLNLPTDKPRPQMRNFAGASLSVVVDEPLQAGIKRLAAESGATLYMIMLAAFNVLLSKYTGQEDIIVGSPVAGRSHADLEPIVGMFVNTLAMRNAPEADKTFAAFLGEVKSNALRAFEHQEYQFETLLDKLSIKRDLSRNPLFDVMLAVQNLDVKEIETSGLRVSAYPLEAVISKFDLTVFVIEEGGRMQLDFEYATHLFEAETIQRMAAHLTQILQVVTNGAEIRLADIEALSEQERSQILHDFNDTSADYPHDQTIHALFAQQAERTPDRTALVGHRTALTYRELNAQTDRLAARLRAQGVGTDRIVALLGDREPETVIGMLGILKSGGAYLPVDPDYPADRIDYMLENSRTELLLAHPKYAEVAQRTGIETILLDETLLTSGEVETAAGKGTASDLAYVMYTSGSTGRPKGVMIEHRNVVRLVQNTNFATFSDGDRILQTGAPVFDACTFEIWGALLNGLELHLVDKQTILDAERLEREVTERQITTMWLTAPLFNQLTLQRPAMFRTLKQLVVGGDVLSPKRINQVRQHSPGLHVINGYGPTENTTFSTTFRIDQDYEASIAIGRPIRNSTAYVVDAHGNLCPVGVPGELWVGGDGVARGYLYNDELTAETFIADPFRQNGRLYRTGDLVRWRADGNIEFIRRIDHQIKIRGFRVEIGEIENAILQHQAIREALVVVHEQEDGGKNLRAYVVAAGTLETAELRAYLSERLPEYMIPPHVIFLDQMPLTPNGKIDRRALPEPEISVLTVREDAAPRNAVERKLTEIWQQVLQLDNIGIHDNFFDLGGHSLNAIQIVSALAEHGWNVSINQVFAHQTPAELAAHLSLTGVIRNARLTDPAQVEALLFERLGLKAKFSSLEDGDTVYSLLQVEDLNSENRPHVVQVLAEEVDPGIRPHYLTDGANELLNLAPEEVSQLQDRLLTEIEAMQSQFAQAITSGATADEYDLSPSQHYHLQHRDLSGTAIPFDRPVDPDLLQAVLANLIATQETMRSVLTDRGGRMTWRVYAPTSEFRLPFVDLSHYDKATRIEVMRAVMSGFFMKQHDLFASLPYRVLLIKENERDHLLLLPFSHIVFDHMSSEVIKQKILTAYERLENGGTLPTESGTRYQDFIAQITRGPSELSDGDISDIFALEEFARASERICHHTARYSDVTFTTARCEVELDVAADATLAETMWIRALDIFARFWQSYLGVRDVPAWMTHYGRNYEQANYFDLIGECIDYLPMLIDGAETAAGHAAVIQEKLRLVSEHNLSFANLLYNERMAEAFGRSRSLLSGLLEQRPINFNYLGEIHANADGLQEIEDSGVNCDDRQRILYTTWHSGNKLYLSVVLPYEERRDTLEQLLRDASQHLCTHRKDQDDER